MNNKVLITGASGLLGQHLVRQLIDSGKSVRPFIRDVSQRSLFPAEVDIFTGDIRSSTDVRNAVDGCDSVIHSCSTHVYNLPYDEFYAVNVTGTMNICDAIERVGCRRLVLTSTISTLQPRSGPDDDISVMPPRKRMSLTKRLAEDEVLSRCHKGLPAVVVNPSYFIGPYDYNPSPFRLLIPLAMHHPVRFVSEGGFNIVSAADVAKAHVWALEEGEIGRRYPVAGYNVTLVDYVSMINSAAGHPYVPKKVSAGWLRRFARGRVFDTYVAEMISQRHFVNDSSWANGPPDQLEPVIEDTVRWFADHSKLTNLWSLTRYVWDRYI